MNPTGFVLPAASIGFGALLIKPRRGFFIPGTDTSPAQFIIAQAVVSERHSDELEITENPVEQGAPVADHAFKRPSEIIIQCGWSNSPSNAGGIISQAVNLGATVAGSPAPFLASIPSTVRAAQSILSGNNQDQVKEIYQKLLSIQVSRVPFDIYTGKRSYTNMLFKTLLVETDQEKENILSVTAICRQVIIVATRVILINPAAQAIPEKTSPIQDQGYRQFQSAPNFVSDSNTLSGSMNVLGGGINSVQATITAGTKAGASLSGPLGQVGGLLSDVNSAIQTFLGDVPDPFNIPVTPSTPQQMSIPMDGLQVTGEVQTHLETVQSTLTQAEPILIAAIQQFPRVSPALPASMNGLGTQLSSVLVQLKATLGQTHRILH